MEDIMINSFMMCVIFQLTGFKLHLKYDTVDNVIFKKIKYPVV